MGLFKKNNAKNSASTPTDPALAELGREYAIARRHRDRKQMNRIVRQVEREYGAAEMTGESFRQGQRSYDDIPPIPQPRRSTRSKRRR